MLGVLDVSSIPLPPNIHNSVAVAHPTLPDLNNTKLVDVKGKGEREDSRGSTEVGVRRKVIELPRRRPEFVRSIRF